MSGSPMNPERLAAVRTLVSEGITLAQTEAGHAALAELLADRDHWEAAYHQTVQEGRAEIHRVIRSTNIDVDDARAEAQRYRLRCPVTAEDVEAAGVTREQAVAWIRAQVPTLFEDEWAEWSEHWLGMPEISPSSIAELCTEAHEEWGFGMSMDILDEMAKAVCPDCKGLGEGTVYERGDGGFSTPQDEPCPSCDGSGMAKGAAR